jgi:hypothetical protein
LILTGWHKMIGPRSARRRIAEDIDGTHPMISCARSG